MRFASSAPCVLSPGFPFETMTTTLLPPDGRLKDGMVAAEQCSRYHMDGSSLVIRDVAEEDAGEYTVLARVREHGLQQNLTLTLVVNGERNASTVCRWSPRERAP